MRSFASTVSVSVFLSAIAVSAWAYVPPSAFVVDKIARKHQNAKIVRVKSRVTAMVDGRPTETQFIAVTTYNSETGHLESYATDDSGQRLYSAEHKTPALPVVLLLDTVAGRLSEKLKAAGVPVVKYHPAPISFASPTPQPAQTEPQEAPVVDPDPTTLSRWKGTVAWVLGDFRKPTTPQLWVEKDTFLPLRLILSDEGGFRDVQCEDFRFHREFPYPQTITVANAKGVATLQAETLEFAPQASVPHATGARAEFTEAGATAPAALRELITTYYATLQ